METIQAIMSRVSVRSFADRPVSRQDIQTILKAGMSGPSAVNARPWSFIVVQDREMLDKMADANGKTAAALKSAPLGILICGDLGRAFAKAPDFWVIDAAIAGQNMSLAAHALGLGSVWLGVWPMERRVQAQAALFDLPQGIVPHSIIAFGYPAQGAAAEGQSHRGPRPEWEADRVHDEKW